MRQIDRDVAVREINSLIRWQEKRKKWHQDKTRQKMATGDAPAGSMPDGGASDLMATFKPDDFGLNALDLQDLGEDDEEFDSTDEDEEDADPIAAERKRRARRQDFLRRSAGEPVKPTIVEVTKMRDGFLSMLRMVLAE